MSTAQEAPALIQYACERCKTRFVLPPSRRRLGFGGRLRATGMALSRTLRFHEGLGTTYDGARRQLLAKMDDDAYQSFVQSFKFCHECRQFVCSECWSNSRRTCLGCFAKAAGTSVRPKPPFAPEGPAIPRPVALTAPSGRRRRLRTDASLLVMGAAILLLVVEAFLWSTSGAGGASPKTSLPAVAAATATPTASPTATPTPIADPTATPTVAPTDTPTPTATPSPSPTASPSPNPTPAPTAKPKPVITPRPYPSGVTLYCTGTTDSITCTTNTDPRATSVAWSLANGEQTSNSKATHVTFSGLLPATAYNVSLTVKYPGHAFPAVIVVAYTI